MRGRKASANSTLVGFTLIEILIAILFLSIGFFGYVALHARLLHSGQKLEEREVVRSATDFVEAVDFTRAVLGLADSIDGSAFPRDRLVPELVEISTSAERRDLGWLNHYPEEYRRGAEETLDLQVTVYQQPYKLTWGER